MGPTKGYPIPPPIREGIGRFSTKCGSTNQPLGKVASKVEHIDTALQVLNVLLTLALLVGNMYFIWKVI